MKPTKNILRRGLFFLIIAAAFLISCNKEPDLIGLDLLPPGDKLTVGFMDTTTIEAYSVYNDKVRTDELVSSQGMIGSIYDPVFGKTTTTLYTQLKMSVEAPAFGINPVCDSLVLVLPYISLFGDKAALITFKVYELSQALFLDSVYYSNMKVDYDPNSLLAQKTFLPRVNDSVKIEKGKKIIPQLRLKFNTALGNRILTASANNLINNENFIQFFKGIAITTDEENTSGEGSLVSFNLLSTFSRLRMYYHNAKDTSVYDFAITPSCARFNQYNHYEHISASPDFKAQLNGDKTLGQQKLYIQALGGTKVKLRFPYLKKWATDNKIIINEAQLIMKNADVLAPYSQPKRLDMRLLYKDETRIPFPIIDSYEAGFDGIYSSAKSYRFRISRYIQQLMRPQTDISGLYLFVPDVPEVSIEYNRLVLNGTSKQLSGNIKLAITYTIIPE